MVHYNVYKSAPLDLGLYNTLNCTLSQINAPHALTLYFRGEQILEKYRSPDLKGDMKQVPY
jgi:hypothetical protein